MNNTDIVALMTWLVPYHSLSFEDAELVAKTTIEEIGGDLSLVSPSDAVKKSLEVCLRMHQDGLVGHSPTMGFGDFGLIRPPIITEDEQYLILGDDTVISIEYFAMRLQKIEVGYSGIERGFDPATGELILVNGKVPDLKNKKRKKVWPVIFSNPFVTQEEIDMIVASPPKIKRSTHLETSSVEKYNKLIELAENNNLHSSAAHEHHPH